MTVSRAYTAAMITPAPHPRLRTPGNAFEWALAVVLWLLAVVMPLALVVWLWPVIMAAGWLGAAVFFVVLAAALFISALILWLGAPLVWLTAALLAGLFHALRGLCRVARP